MTEIKYGTLLNSDDSTLPYYLQEFPEQKFSGFCDVLRLANQEGFTFIHVHSSKTAREKNWSYQKKDNYWHFIDNFGVSTPVFPGNKVLKEIGRKAQKC